jgi:hypothetical protein
VCRAEGEKCSEVIAGQDKEYGEEGGDFHQRGRLIFGEEFIIRQLTGHWLLD